MKCKVSLVIALLLSIVFATIFAFSENALAGQIVRIRTTASLPVGSQIELHANPQNCCVVDPDSGLPVPDMGSMETDVYEFQSAHNFNSYSCSIVSNTTGQALNLRMIGLTGDIIGSCIAAADGTPCTVTGFLQEFRLWLCTVSTAPGRPVAPTAEYTLTIGRPRP
jgi:hypothetical protein